MRDFIKIVEGSLNEKLIIQGRSISDVDDQIYDARIYMNPSKEESEAVLRASRETAIRGLVSDKDGTVYIWDAYACDHGGANRLLRQHGYQAPWPRFAIGQEDFLNGTIWTYIDDGMSEESWAKVPTKHLTRMLGREPIFKPT